MGLVNDIGNFGDAIEKAVRLAGIEEYQVANFNEEAETSLISSIFYVSFSDHSDRLVDL